MASSADDRPGAETPPAKKGSAWTLWVAVMLAFGLLFGAWAVLFKLAGEAKVESVPLATPGAKP